MAYINTIPQAADVLAISQGQILENFAQLETQFSVDHDSLLPAGATGKHLKVTLPERAAPATAAGEGCLYTKDTSGQPELFYREESNGDEIQLTSGGLPGGGHVRAFVYFDKTGTIQGTPFNVTSVTRTGTGAYTIVFTNNFATADYIVTTGYDEPLTRQRGICLRNRAIGSLTIQCVQGNDNVVDLACNLTFYHI